MQKGKLIVIEGLDGSGKATQTQKATEALSAAGVLVRQVSFPNYQSPASAPVKMYLEGAFGDNAGDVNAYAASAFYAVDRYASWKTDWQPFYENGGIVLADRYTTSNIIHQCAKLPETQREEYVAWLEDFEYARLGIPRPGLVLYLDVEPEVSQQLLTRRYAGDNAKKDIHERDVDYLLHCRSQALWAAKALGWHRILCSEAGCMRGIDEVAADIMRQIRETIHL